MYKFSSVIVLATIGAVNAGILAPSLWTSAHLASPLALARVAVPAGSGLEGQWIPDINEKLYDDGSYRPELTPIPLSPSPYGLVPSGSGLEGQYVPQASPLKLAPSPFGLVPAGSGLEGVYVNDLTEKLYDDGSYRPGLDH